MNLTETVLYSCGISLFTSFGIQKVEAKRPNILFIMTDQQRYDMLSCAGNRYVHTPSLDQLAENGVRFERNYCANPKLKAENIHFLEKGQTLKLDRFEITPFDVPHDSTDNVGYSVQYGEVNFCLITDAGHVTEQFGCYIARANYLVLEANHDEDMLMMGPYPAYLKGRISGDYGHLSNKAAAQLLAEHITDRLRHVWLCHISEENNHPELARKTVDTCLRSVGIVAGKDFELEVLKRRIPSEIYELEKK